MRIVSSSTVLVAAFVICITAQFLAAENWPSWRGPAGNGVSMEKALPTQWSKTENVRWRVALPEPGNSTPVVWENKVIVSQPLAKEGKRTLLCLDRRNGKELWQAAVPYAEKELTHQTNPYCSSSPVTDGERVIAWYGSAGVFCYDMDGRELWTVDLGKQTHIWGYGSSPILYGDLCILQFGPGKPSFVIALNKHTGRKEWQIDFPDPPDEPKRNRKNDDETQKTAAAGGDDALATGADGNSRGGIFFGSWGTPMIIRAGGRDELIVAEPTRLASYNPQSGKPHWFSRGLGALVYASPMYGDGAVVALGGYNSAALAAKPGGAGDVTETHRLWHTKRNKLRLGTGIVHDGHLYITDMSAIAQCQELETGKIVWEQRLSSPGGRNDTWSSLVLNLSGEAGGNLYLLNQSGDTFVFKAAPKFELVATNSLDESTNSSIAISDGDLFIRTHEALWCIGK